MIHLKSHMIKSTCELGAVIRIRVVSCQGIGIRKHMT